MHAVANILLTMGARSWFLWLPPKPPVHRRAEILASRVVAGGLPCAESAREIWRTPWPVVADIYAGVSLLEEPSGSCAREAACGARIS
jgi:hypothetical protein